MKSSKFRLGVSGQANPLKKKDKSKPGFFDKFKKNKEEENPKYVKEERRKMKGRRKEDFKRDVDDFDHDENDGFSQKDRNRQDRYRDEDESPQERQDRHARNRERDQENENQGRGRGQDRFENKSQGSKRNPGESSTGLRIGQSGKGEGGDIRNAFKKKQNTSFSRSGSNRSFRAGGSATGFNEKFEARRKQTDTTKSWRELKEEQEAGSSKARSERDDRESREERNARVNRSNSNNQSFKGNRDSGGSGVKRESFWPSSHKGRDKGFDRGSDRDNDREGFRPPTKKSFKPSRQEKFGRNEDRSGRKSEKYGAPNETITGFVKRHPDGFGFLIPDKPGMPDVYVPKPSMVGVMSNDKIEILVRKDGDRFRGETTGIVSRETKKVTGKYIKKGPTQGIIYDESFSWGEDLKVWLPTGLEVKDEDWVLVKITHYPDSPRGFQGEIEAVLGDISDAKNDNIRVLAANNIPYEFTKETLAEAAAIPDHVTEKDLEGRKDLRDKNFITIDGQTAKDFDDAVYVEKMRSGFKLWVAIADVSHYVKPNSAIDKDAYLRGTSTYFPNFVSPMLPESLSNEMCSLKPKVDRLVLVSEMEIDYDGHTASSRFYEAVINSKSRVTYGEAQEIIDGGMPEKHKHVASNIKLASELAHILMKARFDNGSLNLEVPETTIEIDESGLPVDILRSERLFAHRLIEELMLAANVSTAKFLDAKGVPGFYRIHDKPKLDAISILENYLEVFGHSARLESPNLQKKLTDALKAFAGQPQETILNILTLRSMAQAKYSPDNIGHFGLGFSHYSHFTSPIRRYPDLIVHRLIKSVFASQKGYRRMAIEDLETAGTILSSNEQRSVKAERQIHSIKKARFIQKFLGQEFEGVISSVTKFGVFILLRQFDVDGLVRLEELGGDRFEFDEERLVLVGRKSGKTYEIGEPMRVQVAATDIQTGRIDFVLATDDNEGHVTTPKDQSTEKRRPIENNRERVREARVSGPSRKGKAKPAAASGKNSRGSKRRR